MTVIIGILLGGLIGLINFRWLAHIVKGAMSEGKAASLTIKYLLKLLFVAVTTAALLYSRLVEPVAFITGFSITIIMVILRERGVY